MERLLKYAVCCALLLAWAPACESKPETESPTTTKSVAAATETAPEAEAPPESSAETATAEAWLKVPQGELNQAQQAQLDRATAAQKQLGGTLIKALTGSISENGAAASIDFCKQQAPALTAEVAKERGVDIGRTSKKLRNPDNSGPVWVANATDSAGKQAATFAGPNGELGLIAPIMTAELCTTCHGDAEAVPTDVATALDEAYPEDQARGFAEGDLRGWFWVEVPPPS